MEKENNVLAYKRSSYWFAFSIDPRFVEKYM